MRGSLSGVVVLGALLVAESAAASGSLGLGRAADPQDIARWDIDVSPDGTGLPLGHGNAREGAAIYAARCAGCHGARGEGGPMDPLVGGAGTIFATEPKKTVGSFWPYATTLFDYVRRAMPFDAPQSLTADEVYAVSAYILFLNEIVPPDAILDAESLPKIAMPNHGGFLSTDHPPPNP
jgi:cytochrome c